MAKRPNYVFILTDQQRYDSLGITGNAFAKTPCLDSLAREGSLCSHYYTTSAVCMPSRATLLTGLYPHQHRLKLNGMRLEENASEPTLPQLLRNEGYQTASIGKLHLNPYMTDLDVGSLESYTWWNAQTGYVPPFKDYFGFQHSEITIGHGEDLGGHYRQWLNKYFPEAEEKLAAAKNLSECEDIDDCHAGVLPLEAHPTTWCGDRACAQLERLSESESPFFLWLGIPDPHHPFTPPEPLASQFRERSANMDRVDREYLEQKPKAFQQCCRQPIEEASLKRIRQYTDAMNLLIDETVQRVVNQLKALGKYEETIIIFTSDHGDFLGDYGAIRKAPLACDSLHHVPFIVHAPQMDLSPEVGVTWGAIDLLPTICDWSGIGIPKACAGTPLREILEKGRRSLLCWENYGKIPDMANFSILDEGWRYTLYPHTGEEELYALHSENERDQNQVVEEGSATQLDRLRAELKALAIDPEVSLSDRLAPW